MDAVAASRIVRGRARAEASPGRIGSALDSGCHADSPWRRVVTAPSWIVRGGRTREGGRGAAEGAGSRPASRNVAQVENVRVPGFSWQAVVYKDWTTVGVLTPAEDGGDRVAFRVDAAGDVTLMLRPYLHGGAASAPLPKVWVDGELQTTEDVVVAAADTDFNRILRSRQTLAHLALHFYVFPLLCFRNLFSDAVVRRAYLPVGNPATRWLYGPVFEGYALEVSATGRGGNRASRRLRDALWAGSRGDADVPRGRPSGRRSTDREDERSLDGAGLRGADRVGAAAGRG